MSNFITIKLSGRLGNQLYSHSSCMALAIKNDLEYLAYPKPSTHYEENYFEGKFPTYSGQKIDFEWNEPAHGYNEVPVRPNMLINGYMQSYKYFEGLEDQIFPKFGIEPVVNNDTVACHLRFCDFTTIIGKHVVATAAYVKSSIHYFNNKGMKKFLICSDDIEMAKRTLQVSEFNDCEFTFSEGKTPLQDMALLSGCKYLIGSASTFSYWGHFLSTHKDKQLILPDKLWGETHRNMVEEYPPNTIKINTEGVIMQDPYKVLPTQTEIIEEPKSAFSFKDVAKYYVNLDKRTDRNERMKETLAKASIEATRIRGILPEELDLSNPKYQVMKNRTVGALGCWLSQVKCLELAAQENKSVLIMEDDLEFASDIQERIKIIEGFCNTHEWDIIFFGATFHTPAQWHTKNHHPDMQNCKCTLGTDIQLTDNKHIMRVYGMWGTYCWMVNKNSIEKIIKMLDGIMEIAMGIDWALMALSPNLNCYCFVSGAVRQYDGESNIGTGITKFSGFSALGKYWFTDKLEEFDPSTYNWGEAAIRTQPTIEAKNTEAPVESKPEPVAFTANTPEWFLQQAGIYDSLKDAGLLEAALVSINKHTKHKLETNMDALQKELLGTCRFDCSFYANKYKS